MQMDRLDYILSPVYRVHNIWTGRPESSHLHAADAYMARQNLHDDGRVALAARCIIVGVWPTAAEMTARQKSWPVPCEWRGA